MNLSRYFSLGLLLIGLVILLAACNQAGSTSPADSLTTQPTSSLGASPTPPPGDTASPEPTGSPTTPPPTATPMAELPATLPMSPPAGESTATIPPSPTPPAFPPSIALEPVLGGFEAPVYLTHAGEGLSGGSRLYIVEKVGRIYLAENGVVQPTPFLDISARVGSQGSEQGLLSLAFPPDFGDSGLFYVNYTDLNGDTVVASYRRLAGNPGQGDPGSEQKILQIEQPAANHNGGQLQFGPDGYMYIGMGDGGRAGDPWGNAQNPEVLLGKLLRIDVSGTETYTVPDSNPLLGQPGARPEIWATGLRNPWRFSFDRATDDLYIADVGQNIYEEVDFQPAAGPGGQNYGWDIMEGNHCFEPQTGCDTGGLVPPAAEYDHSQGCSVTGGHVYRGTRYPQLTGVYFFGDFCSGNIWGLRREGSGQWQMALLLDTELSISSFGEDAAGEIYVIGYRDGNIYHLTASQ